MSINRLKEGLSITLLRDIPDQELAAMATQTGGQEKVRDDGKGVIVLWERGGIRRDEHATGVKVSGRGILARFGAFLEDAAVIRRPLTAMVVFPTAPGELIQAYRVRQGRMSVVEKLPSRASDALKTAANLAWETAQRSPNRSGR
ncbi:MAG: hypothetical protein UR81_C0022G0011 [Candidatus Levybacteria bacterium GW2011_GWB1_35_5]|nr:MAG: hypothetical protein UR81_C0022G0011 [Candidatus Levybacteria bacterium GW2011_GWB1_35_5]